jgi:hypothetical protein
MQYSKGKSALIFCSTRKGAQEAAQRLAQIVMNFGQSNPFIKSREQQDHLREASMSLSDKQMQSYILYGGMLFFLLEISYGILLILTEAIQSEICPKALQRGLKYDRIS